MAGAKKSDAYFTVTVKNSYKNEYRSNDNYYNHVSSVGDEVDIERETAGKNRPENIADDIDQQLSESSAENWLLFMENERLHTALSGLPLTDVEFLLELAGYHFNKTAYAQTNGSSQQAVSKRFHKLRKKILENL